MTHNLVHYDRTKHVEIEKHFIKEKMEEGIINLSYVSTKFQDFDLLAKTCSKPEFEFLVNTLKMTDIYFQA